MPLAQGGWVGGKWKEKIQTRSQDTFFTFKMTLAAIIWKIERSCLIKYLNKK